MSFFKNGGQEGETGPVWVLVLMLGGGYGGNINILMYENGKMRCVETEGVPCLLR
jgi:hypothetical protein